MPNAISNLFSNVTHWFMQVAGPVVGELEAHLNIDDLLPPPKWYMKEVDPGHLWRGAEPKGPSWNHWAEIKARGIKSVVSLQVEERSEAREAKPYGINTLKIAITDNTAPSMAQIQQFLDFVARPENQPASVHCRAGKGRTGVMVACYRIAVQHWSADAAVAEAKAMGMAMDTQERCIRQFAASRSGRVSSVREG